MGRLDTHDTFADSNVEFVGTPSYASGKTFALRGGVLDGINNILAAEGAEDAIASQLSESVIISKPDADMEIGGEPTIQ